MGLFLWIGAVRLDVHRELFQVVQLAAQNLRKFLRLGHIGRVFRSHGRWAATGRDVADVCAAGDVLDEPSGRRPAAPGRCGGGHRPVTALGPSACCGSILVCLVISRLNDPDLAAARAYYDALLPLVGFETFFATADQCAYKPAGGKPGTYLFLYPAVDLTPYSGDRTGLQHLAFMVRTPGDVDRVHRHVLSLGGEVIHRPRVFPEYPPHYYATFWRDPFGIKLEAVCHYDRD